MTSSDGQEMKYIYRSTFPSKKASDRKDEPSKAELQKYINQVLGTGKDSDSDSTLTA